MLFHPLHSSCDVYYIWNDKM